MLLGSDYGFASLPFASITNQNNVTISVTKVSFTLGIGNISITADSITELPHSSQVVLGLGTVTVTADAEVDPTKSSYVLGTGIVTVSADANSYPSGSGVVITSGTVTITADANVEPTGGTLTLSTGTAQAITWSEIGPGVSMVWVPIVPY